MAHQQIVAALMIPGLPYLHLPAMLMAMTVRIIMILEILLRLWAGWYHGQVCRRMQIQVRMLLRMTVKREVLKHIQRPQRKR